MKVQTFVMMGRPGAGKGTQAKLLSQALGYELFSTGARTRALAQEDTYIGKKIKQLSDEGSLQPHWLGSFFFEELLLSRPKKHGIVFDGTCRRLLEAQLFEEVTAWLERPFRVIYLDVSEQTILTRLEKRQAIEGRKDDLVESVTKRFEHFTEETEPAIAYLRSKDAVIDVPGEGEPEAIFAELRTRIESL